MLMISLQIELKAFILPSVHCKHTEKMRLQGGRRLFDSYVQEHKKKKIAKDTEYDKSFVFIVLQRRLDVTSGFRKEVDFTLNVTLQTQTVLKCSLQVKPEQNVIFIHVT